MSMPQEIVDKFQQYLDDLSGSIVDVVQHALPDLSPKEQKETPILMSDSAFATCLIEVSRAMAINQYSIYGGEGCVFKCDISLSNNNLSFSLGDFVGITSTWVDYWNDRNVILENADHWKWNIAHDGEITARIWDMGFDFRLYYENAYHDTDISLDWNIPLELADCKQYSAASPSIRTGNSGVISYTVGADDVITVTPDRDLQPNSFNNLVFALKGYPIIINASDMTYINDFVTNNNATNNYNTTYTTPDNKTITVYYGDNYIITHVNNNDPVSYDDIKNALNIAINQINDDNDIDLDVPDYPIPPPSDYTDDNFGLTTTGFSSNIGGAGNYWLMSLSNLAGFISDFKTTAPAGAMISQNILSCYVNALNYEWETGKDNIVIHAAGAQNTPYTSTSQYDNIYQYNPHVVVGQYKVPRVTETFYDFNPYSTYELYIPFCGWIGLPDTVAGRNIRVYMDFDVATMSCKAYVMVEMEDGSGATICGEITGSFGAPCPVQVIEGGLYKQAMINSGLQIASGVVSGLMGGAFGGPVGASMLATGGMNAVQGLASAYMAGNTNYGQTIGRAGDTSGLCGGHYCYIKITHPVIDEVVDTETFGHTTGYPCYMESELSSLVGSGFTVCLNPHVHVNCTQSEKDEIKQLLESGVIL